MNNIQVFQSEQFGQIRTAVTDMGEPLLAATDVARSLGYSNPQKAIRDHCKGVNETFTPTESGVQGMKFIPESDVYRLIMRSKLPQAEKFQDWACEEVFPSLRKTGGYMVARTDETPEQLMARALKVAEDTLKRTEAEKQRLIEQNELSKQQLQAAAPKVQYYNDVLMSGDTYTTTQIAKELGMGAPTLNDRLRKLGVQYKQNGQWLLTHRHQNRGYTKTHTHTFTHSNGQQGTAIQTVWTEKGRQWVHGLINN